MALATRAASVLWLGQTFGHRQWIAALHIGLRLLAGAAFCGFLLLFLHGFFHAGAALFLSLLTLSKLHSLVLACLLGLDRTLTRLCFTLCLYARQISLRLRCRWRYRWLCGSLLWIGFFSRCRRRPTLCGVHGCGAALTFFLLNLAQAGISLFLVPSLPMDIR